MRGRGNAATWPLPQNTYTLLWRRDKPLQGPSPHKYVFNYMADERQHGDNMNWQLTLGGPHIITLSLMYSKGKLTNLFLRPLKTSLHHSSAQFRKWYCWSLWPPQNGLNYLHNKVHKKALILWCSPVSTTQWTVHWHSAWSIKDPE